MTWRAFTEAFLFTSYYNRNEDIQHLLIHQRWLYFHKKSAQLVDDTEWVSGLRDDASLLNLRASQQRTRQNT
jgi:hypothetical protein